MGQMFLVRNSLEEAMEQLVQGFEIDASFSNIPGLIIVTPLLTDCLCKLSKLQEALAYCQRGIKMWIGFQFRYRLTEPTITTNGFRQG